MTSAFERSILIFGNSSISNSLCNVLVDDFDIYYLPNFPINSGYSYNRFISDIGRRPWLRKCNIIKSIMSLNHVLSTRKLLTIISSSSASSIAVFSKYVAIRTHLKIYHMTSSHHRLDKLLETLNSNVIPCYPNIVTEFKQTIIKTVGKFIVDVPAENLCQSSKNFLKIFNQLSNSVTFNIRKMENLFKARFIVTTYTYSEIFRHLSTISYQRNYFIELDLLWNKYKSTVVAFEEYSSCDLSIIKQYARYLALMDPNSSDIAWIINTLVFDKPYKMERFIKTFKNGI